MAAFLRTAAIMVGLANAVVYSMIGDDGFQGPFIWKLEPWPLTALYAGSAILAGLLVSGGLIRFAGRDLRGSFFARYGLMSLAICLGGILSSLLLAGITISFDDNVMVLNQPSECLSAAIFATLAGGVLGAVEGVILAFPLAGLLGLFRERG